jgi:hypothetical protein
MRRRLLPGLLGSCGAALLTVEPELRVQVVVLHLHELEVSEPRSDFDQEVASAEAAVRAGQVGDPRPARVLYRRTGPPARRCFGGSAAGSPCPE